MRKKLENYITNVIKCERLFAEKSRIERVKSEYEPSILGSGFGGVRASGVSSPTENSALHNIEFIDRMNEKIAKCVSEIEEVEAEIKAVDDYINAIEDLKLQEIFNLRFKQGVSWANIAISFYYSQNSWIMLKKRVEDYINEN